MNDFIYLASPYTHDNAEVMQKRYEQVREKAAELMDQGLAVFSPIVHGHAICEAHNLPIELDFWEKQFMPLLLSAKIMVVYKMPGWRESRGVALERNACELHGIPVLYAECLTGSNK